RFKYIEKLKDREEFLHAMIQYFRNQMFQISSDRGINETIKDYLKELLQAERWAKQNVNIRAILEYLMLSMPSKL
ncbi:hypothetical protein KKE03_00910, partial [Patescibacteria group bacterium]|nr:hypothetical protein [Patescibacteria group bacterium]